MDLATAPALALYAALKLGAYTAWCALGLARLRPGSPRRAALALGLGVLRLALGLAFGLGIWLGTVLVVAGLDEAGVRDPTLSLALAYAAVYVPVRWVEWGIVEALLVPGARSLAGFSLGSGGAARRWRSGGIVLSCLADVPLVLAVGGLPVGRFMC